MYTQIIRNGGIFWLTDMKDSDIVLAEVELGADPERVLRELAEEETGWDFHGVDPANLIEDTQSMTDLDMGTRHYWEA